MYLFPERWYVTADCPDDWRRHTGSCDLFVTRYPMEWIDALVNFICLSIYIYIQFIYVSIFLSVGHNYLSINIFIDLVVRMHVCMYVCMSSEIYRYIRIFVSFQTFCKLHGGKLAEVESRVENNFLMSQAKLLGGMYTQQFCHRCIFCEFISLYSILWELFTHIKTPLTKLPCMFAYAWYSGLYH